MKKTTKIKLYILVACVAFAIIGSFVVLFHYSSTPINLNGSKDSVVLVEIPAGSSFAKSTKILNKAGLIKSSFLFYCLAFIKRATNSIRSGEYEFNDSMTPSAVIDELLSGENKRYIVFIPEDLTIKEIAEILNNNKLIDKKEFMALAYDRDFLNTLGIKANSIEGYLFPNTYYFDPSMSAQQIIKIMYSEFFRKVTPEMVKRAKELGLDLNQFVTLASIIGKESDVDAKKHVISAMFHDRLKKGMRLQSSPTAVYDLENFDGKILRSHLKRISPYNTYVINGLPPGPIGNPGIDSLNATLYPAKEN